MNKSRTVALLVLALSGGAVAQAPDQAELQRLMEQARQMQQNMPDAAQMQQMQAKALEMQACMANIDQSALQTLQREGQALGQEIRALCSAGKREQAQARALDYGQRVAASPALAELRKCGEQMQGMMGALPGFMDRVKDGEGASHVCDVRQ